MISLFRVVNKRRASPTTVLSTLFLLSNQQHQQQTIMKVTMATTSSSSSSSLLPSTLTGPPIRNLVDPGKCQLGETPVACKLIQKHDVSPTSSVFRFQLPNADKPLNLSTCACVLAKIVSEEEEESDDTAVVVRPYTPISTNDQIGSFDLLVKKYENGKMSSFLHNNLKVGSDDVQFFHISKNVKIQASEFLDGRFDTIVMIAGGTGITPMIQALHAILGNGKNGKTDADDAKPAASPKVILLYGSRTSDDILGKDLLDRWAADYPSQFQCVHVLSEDNENEPQSKRSKSSNDGDVCISSSSTRTEKYEHGYIDEKLYRKYVAPSTSSSSPDNNKICVFVCGPSPMYNALCGPREKPDEVTGLLGKLGYEPHQVYKF